MSEEKKEMVLKFLREHPDEKFNIRQLCFLIKDISYPTILKWISVLEAERKIRVEDYGNVKIIRLNKEFENEN